jgi:hypothetical protein
MPRCCKEVYTSAKWPTPAGLRPCKRKGNIERDGKLYCEAHDPERRKAQRAHRTAAVVATKPIAYMRRWAYDGVDVMALKKADRPRGWQMHAVTVHRCCEDDIPLGEISEVTL